MKIDKAALDYLIEVAKQIGFKVRSVDITEEDGGIPTFTLYGHQTHEPTPVLSPVLEPGIETENPRRERRPNSFATLDD